MIYCHTQIFLPQIFQIKTDMGNIGHFKYILLCTYVLNIIIYVYIHILKSLFHEFVSQYESSLSMCVRYTVVSMYVHKYMHGCAHGLLLVLSSGIISGTTQKLYEVLEIKSRSDMQSTIPYPLYYLTMEIFFLWTLSSQDFYVSTPFPSISVITPCTS